MMWVVSIALVASVLRAEPPAKADKPRNPFGVADVQNPDDKEVKEFAAKVKLSGDAKDANAAKWVEGAVTGKEGSLDGEWSSRWNGGGAGKDWASGTATVKAVGDWVYILYKDGTYSYLIEAKFDGKNRFVGRYVNLRDAKETTPWVGVLVNAERIDGQWTLGRWDLRRKLGTVEKTAKGCFHRGYALMQKADYDKAIVEYTEAIRLDPKYALAYTHRAVAYFNKGEVDKAIADNSEAIRIDPKLVVAYRNRGREYGQKNEHAKAIADFSEAIKLQPQHADAYNDRSISYRQTGEYDKAIDDCNMALQLNPKLAPLVYLNRGKVYLLKDEVAKAVADFSEAIKLTPDDGQLYYLRAKAYRRLGQLQQAEQDERRAKELKK
jgi:tetratricopeptide (TPR) repeat protein